MVRGGPVQTPYVWDSGFDANGKGIRITLTFNNATRALSGATIVRDAGCLYRQILVGVGADGRPDSSTRAFNVPFGTTAVTQAQLNARNLTTIEDFLAFQLTAGF